MIVFNQISRNVSRIAFETERERKALDRLLERKIKDPDTGVLMPITVVWEDERGPGFIPAGLVPWLLEKLKKRFRVEDHPIEEDDTFFPIDGSCFVNMEPRDYQIEAGRTLLSYPRGIIKATTGAGKTAIMGAMIHAILRVRPDWRILVLGFTVDHWGQVQRSFSQMNIPSQQVGQGDPQANVLIGRFDAFSRYIAATGPWNDCLRTAEVVMYDEVRHLGTANTYINFARSINPQRNYGFDATPLKNYEDTSDPYKMWEDMNTIGYCGPLQVKVGYRELQRLGWLPLTYVHFVNMPKPPKPLMKGKPRNLPITTNYTVIYKHGIVENDYRTARFARLIANRAGAGKVIAMVKQHEHAKRLMKMLMDNGIESLAWLGSKKALACTPSRGVYPAPFNTDEVRRRFTETDLPVVVGSMVLSEAISLDCATDAVNLAAGNTFALSNQRDGRIMRRDGGRTPVVNFWDAEDHFCRILLVQSNQRRKHFEAEGLDVVDVPCPESLRDLHQSGFRTGRLCWPHGDLTST
jgi:superfamily II DNA or RNA helicase